MTRDSVRQARVSATPSRAAHAPAAPRRCAWRYGRLKGASASERPRCVCARAKHTPDPHCARYGGTPPAGKLYGRAAAARQLARDVSGATPRRHVAPGNECLTAHFAKHRRAWPSAWAVTAVRVGAGSTGACHPAYRRNARRDKGGRHALTNWMTSLILRLSNRSMIQATPPRTGLMPEPEQPNQRQKRARSSALPSPAPQHVATFRVGERLSGSRGRA